MLFLFLNLFIIYDVYQKRSLATRSTDLLFGPQKTSCNLAYPCSCIVVLILLNRYTSFVPVNVLPVPSKEIMIKVLHCVLFDQIEKSKLYVRLLSSVLIYKDLIL